MGNCWNCGRENAGDTCYSCGFEVIHREPEFGECDCDPSCCSHGYYKKCDKCREDTHFEDLTLRGNKEYCQDCIKHIEHAEKNGSSNDIWEAENVE